MFFKSDVSKTSGAITEVGQNSLFGFKRRLNCRVRIECLKVRTCSIALFSCQPLNGQ